MATKPIFDDVTPWPEAKPAPAAIGHNRPPPEEAIPAEFRAALIEEKPEFFTILDNYLGTTDPETGEYVDGVVDRAECTDNDTLGRCGEVIKILRKASQMIGDVHKRVKEPFLTSGRLCDAEKNALAARIEAGRAKVEGKMNAYAAEQRRIEQERRRKEEEERRRLEELAKENDLAEALPPPPPPAPKAEPVRSDGGATVSTTVEHIAIVEDYAKAFRKVKDDARVRDAIDAAIQRLVKGARGNITIPGVRIDERTRTIAR